MLKNPLQHIPIPVNTAIALPSINPSSWNLGTRLNAAPTAPKDAIGTATHLGLVNPNNQANTKLIIISR